MGPLYAVSVPECMVWHYPVDYFPKNSIPEGRKIKIAFHEDSAGDVEYGYHRLQESPADDSKCEDDRSSVDEKDIKTERLQSGERDKATVCEEDSKDQDVSCPQSGKKDTDGKDTKGQDGPRPKSGMKDPQVCTCHKFIYNGEPKNLPVVSWKDECEERDTPVDYEHLKVTCKDMYDNAGEAICGWPRQRTAQMHEDEKSASEREVKSPSSSRSTPSRDEILAPKGRRRVKSAHVKSRTDLRTDPRTESVNSESDTSIADIMQYRYYNDTCASEAIKTAKIAKKRAEREKIMPRVNHPKGFKETKVNRSYELRSSASAEKPPEPELWQISRFKNRAQSALETRRKSSKVAANQEKKRKNCTCGSEKHTMYCDASYDLYQRKIPLHVLTQPKKKIKPKRGYIDRSDSRIADVMSYKFHNESLMAREKKQADRMKRKTELAKALHNMMFPQTIAGLKANKTFALRAKAIAEKMKKKSSGC